MLKNIFGCALFLMIGACAQAPVNKSVASTGGNDALAKMALARWDLMIQGKIDEAYQDYVSPATKVMVSRESYRGTVKPGLWKSAKVNGVTCASEDVCTVDVIVSYAYKGKGGIAFENDAVVPETWRNIDGRWWFVPRQ